MKIRRGQRLISAVLAASMLIGVVPVSAFAAGTTETEAPEIALEQENDTAGVIVIDRWNITAGSDDGSWSYQKNNSGKDILTLKKGVFQLDLDMDPQATLKIEKDATLLGCTKSYTIKCSVDNAGTIEGGIFAEPSDVWIKNGSTSTLQKAGGSVGNSGTITGGTFKGSVGNGQKQSGYGSIPDSGFIYGGTYEGTVKNYGTIDGSAEFVKIGKDTGIVKNFGVINGGTFTNCDITNSGTNAGQDATNVYRGISGGTFNGCTVKNGDAGAIGLITGGRFFEGTVTNGERIKESVGVTTNYGIINGGAFTSTIDGAGYSYSTINNGVFAGDVTNQTINGGIFKDDVVQADKYTKYVVKFANGTDKFSLLQNGDEDLSGIISNIAVIYVVGDNNNFTVSPSVAITDVNGDRSITCEAEKSLNLSTAAAKNERIEFNTVTKKTPTHEDFRWDAAQKKVVSDVSGIGEITTYFDGKTTVPDQPGTYKITYESAESETYTAFKGPEDTGWTYCIYSITVTGGTADKSAAAAGEQITLKKGSVPEGHTFESWSVNGSEITGDSFEMPSSDVKVTANYLTNSYTLTVNGEPEQKAYGADIEVTAEDKEGQTFTGWTMDGVEVADKSSKILNFRMPANNVTLTANYSTNSYTLTVNGEPEQKTYGADVEVMAEDKEGQTFTGWTVDGVEVSDKSSKTLNFRMPANNVTLTANYSTNSYTLTVNGEPEQKTYGADVEVTAEDKEGQTFTGWTVDGVEVADNNSKTLNFRMPANDVTLTANYSTNSYTLTVNGEPEQKAYGADIEVTAEDKEGQTFTGWTVDGMEIADKSSKILNFRMPANNVTLTANYSTNSYTLTVNGEPEQKAYGADIEVTAEDKEGQTFTGWTVDGVEVADNNSKTLNFRMPANDVTLTANYSTNSYTLTVNGQPEQKTYGADVEVTAEDKEGQTFTGWTVDGVEVADKSSKTLNFRMPANDVTLTANYQDIPKLQYTLTVEGGTPASTTAEAGTEVTLTADEPEIGKLFDKWELSENLTLASGELTDTTITVKMPEGDATAKATYKDALKPQYTLMVECGTPASTTAEAGTEVTLTADEPEIGEMFDKWELSENLTLVSGELTDTTITVKIPEGDATAKATYKEEVNPEPVQPDVPSDDGGAGLAIAAVGGIAVIGAAVGVGVMAVNHYITANLPEGFELPTTRQETAVVLWNMAGKPDVLPATNFVDVTDAEAQKAVSWVIEHKLMEPDSETVFGAQKPVNKWTVYQLMKKVSKNS